MEAPAIIIVRVILIIIVGCLLLAVANVAFWAALNLFDAQRFGKLVAEGVQSDQVSQVLAGEIVDQLLADHPDIPVIVSSPAKEIVTELLQGPLLTEVIEDTAGLTSS